MSTAVLTANLGNFDSTVEPVGQTEEYTFHRFTDENFPPITGLTPRFQYRIPKYFGWQLMEGYDIYVWLDASVSLIHPGALKWLIDQLANFDVAVFRHPWRSSIQEETDHIEEYLNKGNKYITSRYKNGLHKEQLRDIKLDTNYVDDHLYASTAFVYRDTEQVRDALRLCWLHQSRYFTCDQLAFTYALKDLDVKVMDENPFSGKYLGLVSKHE